MARLERLTERIWIFPTEEERDRPNLGYIRGDKWSLAVDAGHSEAHMREFYGALEESGLPLPELTVLTHWHWDHTFAMHAIHGLSLANERTDRYLTDIRDRLRREGNEFFFDLHETIRREYAGDRPVIVTNADLVFEDRMMLDVGNCRINIFRAESPHTDDSTLVEIPGEKVLFVGDAVYGVFPDWKKDLSLCEKMAEAIRGSAAEICVEGHFDPAPKEETIRSMMENE